MTNWNKVRFIVDVILVYTIGIIFFPMISFFLFLDSDDYKDFKHGIIFIYSIKKKFKEYQNKEENNG